MTGITFLNKMFKTIVAIAFVTIFTHPKSYAVSLAEAESVASEKIELKSVTPFMIRATRGYHAWTMVRIITTEGIEGIGEGFSWGKEKNNLQVITNMQEMIRDITKMGSISLEEFYSKVVNPKGVKKDRRAKEKWYSAAAAIELAFWDIYGKRVNKPVWRLLGEKIRNTVPLYADHGVFYTTDSERKIDPQRILLMKEQGYSMFKWDPFSYRNEPTEGELKADIAEIVNVRELVGPDFPLAIDAHCRNNTKGGIVASRAMENLNISFFEEPVKSYNLDGYKSIAAATNIPLAGGERVTTFHDFEILIDSKSVKIIQPDIGVCGILTALRAGELAREKGIKVYPHIWCGPAIASASAHIAAVLPNVTMVEYAACSPDITWEHKLISPSLTADKGQLKIPMGAGLGFVLNEQLVKERIIR